MRSQWIVVVEDDDRLRESWIEALRRETHKVIGSRDGAEALDLLCAVAPHLVILGRQLPLTSGVTILDKMQHELPLSRYMGILVISACPADVPAFPSGLSVLGVLAKPVRLPALIDAVRHALDALEIWTEHGQIGTKVAGESPPRHAGRSRLGNIFTWLNRRPFS
jgi:DNA-binding NtrC family response regulator